MEKGYTHTTKREKEFELPSLNHRTATTSHRWHRRRRNPSLPSANTVSHLPLPSAQPAAVRHHLKPSHQREPTPTASPFRLRRQPVHPPPPTKPSTLVSAVSATTTHHHAALVLRLFPLTR
ncbi:hypothetical protein U1Q18_025489 [Sarracenia purpurea var. burkii]